MTARPDLPVLVDAVALREKLGAVDNVLLALDFDGTLAPIVNHPDDAKLLHDAELALATLQHHLAVAVVSGRPLDELLSRFTSLPNVILAAGHGHVVKDTNGAIHTFGGDDTTKEACVHVAKEVAAVVSPHAGWQVEIKPSGVAVHHRNVSSEQIAPGREHVLSVFSRHTKNGTFRLLNGHCVDELTLASATKGGTLSWLLNRFPGCTPVVFGDDTTDEDMFEVARQHGGSGILVADAPRTSGAFYRVQEPADVAAFLRLLADRFPSSHR